MNESQKNKRRIALAVPKIKLERKNNKSQVLTIGEGRYQYLKGWSRPGGNNTLDVAADTLLHR